MTDRSSLELATRLLEEGRPAAALEALIDAWRTLRVAALADLIDTLGDALTERLPPVEGKTRNALQTAWLDLLNERKDVDLGRLLAVFTAPPFTAVGVRIERLSQHDDPRVARAFADFAREPPTIGGIKGSRWTMLLKALERMRDSRSRPALARLVASDTPDVMFEEHIAPLATRVLETLSDDVLTAADEAHLATLRALVERVCAAPLPEAAALRSDTSRAKPAVSEESLLELIYTTPEDDTPRLVYGDWLQEQGDPRAELLTLQLKPKTTSKEQQRVRQLLKAHGRAWLGVLEPAILRRSEVFARGFPSTAHLAFTTPKLKAQLTGHPAWNTFTELIGLDAEFLEHTELRGLETLRYLDERQVLALPRRKHPLRRVQVLGVNVPAEVYGELPRAPVPALTTLEVFVPMHERERFPLAVEKLLPLLRRASAARFFGVVSPEAFQRLSTVASLRRIRFALVEPFDFLRLSDGRWVLDLVALQYPVKQAPAALGALLPLVSGLLEPSPDWGPQRPVARAFLERACSLARVPMLPRSVLEAG
ncbi:MAG: TIGR02996 domain-containing protein [Archangium sp.]|nr:TIGR02996 domain-containing protein [Archangium sp.]